MLIKVTNWDHCGGTFSQMMGIVGLKIDLHEFLYGYKSRGHISLLKFECYHFANFLRKISMISVFVKVNFWKLIAVVVI